MTGITDLDTLLSSLQPRLHDEVYVFVTLSGAAYDDVALYEPVAAISETEGLTLVMPRSRADAASLSYDGVFRKITLQVHSSLEAVGLTAAVATRLAEHGISANMIAGYYHDHVFVPADRAEEAFGLLLQLSEEGEDSVPFFI
jgi:hypothetical protein